MKDDTCEVRGFLHPQVNVEWDSLCWCRDQPDSGQTSV